MSLLLAGDVMGDIDDAELDGIELVGVQRRGVPAKPRWRNRLAPGVQQPGYGVVPLTLKPQDNGGVFDPTHQIIQFLGKTQKPFRGERFVATIARTAGAAGVLLLSSPIFVGTDPQQADLNETSLDAFAPTAFGVRYIMIQVEPGVEVTVNVRANPAVPAANTVAVNLMIMGRYAH